MSKYSLKYLDKKMVFDHAIYRSLSDSISFSCTIKRMDDFELSIELTSDKKNEILPFHIILNKAMPVFAKQFWNEKKYIFKKVPQTDILIDSILPISIDIILIKSSNSEINVEFFVYQRFVSLYTIILKMQSIQ